MHMMQLEAMSKMMLEKEWSCNLRLAIISYNRLFPFLQITQKGEHKSPHLREGLYMLTSNGLGWGIY